MLAFLREHNDSKSVTDIFNYLYNLLGDKNFKKIFPVILTDNGSEFTNPLAIELDSDGNCRTKIFFCDPNAPYQKGAIEHNHTLIRRIIKKGCSFDDYSQDDINLMMNHINSYSREKLDNKTPFDYFQYQYGKRNAKKLGLEKIDSNSINLTTKLLIKSK